ncbi:coiled-coil domain-containing protein [Streptomyces griseiscabiei]|uniref:Secreted protein n=1 Tax=Streptomyces griseiscabiei TaxID=2993540 RepID=A0ABU4L8R7_9ACTN|nr:hypothetical protein [Streptomyces griseiscabiei]MDX2911544.1 hypothetical protein [Streptomyces griseiscabiei]
MPRGRHRHSPPLHRLLPPTAIAGVSLVCALGPWVFSEPSVLRVTAAVAAATAAVGAAVMRRWDVEAGKRVADLTRARASDEWRHEERAAELETDLDESRELRTKLEHKLRAKRTELAGLRNEHAALLRRYATAETERASALEGRRLLEIEATAPEDADTDTDAAPAEVSPVPPQGVPASGAPWASWETASKAAAAKAATSAKDGAVAAPTDAADPISVFSPSGSSLFLRANSALDRIITQRGAVKDEAASAETVEPEVEPEPEVQPEVEPEAGVDAEADADAVSEEAVVEGENAPGADESDESDGPAEEPAPAESGGAAVKEQAPKGGSPKGGGGPSPKGDPDGPTDGGTRQGRSAEVAEEPVPVLTAEEDDAAGKSVAVRGHERATADSAPARSTGVGELTRVEPSGRVGQVRQAEQEAPAALPALPSAGHFTVPTAVAVMPAAPQRRVAVEGGFDFFGTQKGADALEAVQNEDLADVVGQEALALHKAESEARFKPADEASRGIGQVIDLTAHDETEQINVESLRTAAS